MTQPVPEHWLARYANNYHAWTTTTTHNGQKAFTRPLGMVEFSFDTDGTEYGGRADMHSLLTLEINHTLSTAELRNRIALAWANLRLQHPLLMSRTIEDPTTRLRNFVIDIPPTPDAAHLAASSSIAWLEDHHSTADPDQFLDHALNTARIIMPQTCLSKLHVLPLIPLPNGHSTLRLLTVLAHQISDGLSSASWSSHLLRTLNLPATTLAHDLARYSHPRELRARLPPAQEDLYPRVPGNTARQRWFWAILRVLRHIRAPLQPTFTNPLRRAARLPSAPLPPMYPEIFNYTPAALPPLQTHTLASQLSPTASARLLALSRAAHVTLGAGFFALVALSMVALYERRDPAASERRLPFTAGFPLNPRPFLSASSPPPPDSCMLAFNQGIVLPFLGSELPLEPRFRLVARQANRGLGVYQKRGVSGREAAAEGLGSRSLLRLLADAYIFQLERVESKLPPHRRRGVNPQGELLIQVGKFAATCGVSSLGSTAKLFAPGAFDLGLSTPSAPSAASAGDGGEDTRDFTADFRGIRTAVRAREGEFLVGGSTDSEGIVRFSVSYDGSFVAREDVEAWADCMRGFLEERG